MRQVKTKSGMNRFGVKHLWMAATLFAVLSMAACVAAIPVAIKYYKDAKFYAVRAEMPVSADKVYNTALNMAEQRTDVKILKKDDKALFLEVTDGIQVASLKAEPVSGEKTDVTIKADVPEGKEKEKELALRIINNICNKLEVKCTVEKQL
ncbi:MAG: hypothetical protein AB1442_11520 [Nitrospirota bacterium]